MTGDQSFSLFLYTSFGYSLFLKFLVFDDTVYKRQSI